MMTMLPGVGRGVTMLSPGSLLTSTGGVAGGVGGNTGATGAAKGVTLLTGACSTFFGLGVINLEFFEFLANLEEDLVPTAGLFDCLGGAWTLAGVFETDLAGVFAVALDEDFEDVLTVDLEMSIKTAAKESFTDDLDEGFIDGFDEDCTSDFTLDFEEVFTDEDDEEGFDLRRPEPFFIWSTAYLL